MSKQIWYAGVLGLALQFMGENSQAQRIQLAPKMELKERIKVAKEILDSTYLDSDSTKPEERVTEYRVLIDPVGTADFIIKHPVGEDGMLWDHNAISYLARNPQRISDDQIFDLLETQTFEYAYFIYLNTLLDHLPDDKIELKSRLKKQFLSKAFEHPFEHPYDGLGSLVSRKSIAEKLGIDEKADELKKKLHQFFASGAARKEYDALKEPLDSRGQLDHVRIIYYLNAPEEFRNEYTKFSTSSAAIHAVLNCAGLSTEQRIEQLNQALKTSIGRWSHEYMPVASRLDAIARLDIPLAEKWIEKLPDEGARCWARICIASGMAKQNPEIAKQQIRRAYEDLKMLGNDSEDSDRAYNAPLPLIGGVGLRAVELVDPTFMETAIEIVANAAPAMLDLPLADSRANYFEVTAAIARYDRLQAEELFDRAKDEVDLHSAASYFVALAAIDPVRISEEYLEIPLQADARGITYRPYIRNAIVMALMADDDDEFWDGLAEHSGLTIPVPEK